MAKDEPNDVTQPHNAKLLIPAQFEHDSDTNSKFGYFAPKPDKVLIFT